MNFIQSFVLPLEGNINSFFFVYCVYECFYIDFVKQLFNICGLWINPMNWFKSEDTLVFLNNLIEILVIRVFMNYKPCGSGILI